MTAPVVDEAPAGLTAAEAARRLEVNGANDVPAVRAAGWWHAVSSQLRDTVVLVLLGAAVLTSAVGDWADTAVIAAVVILNTALGAMQELRASRALTALAVLTAPQATVVRDGRAVRVPASQVVRGDRLRLAAGDIVAADARIETTTALDVDESTLTGESMPVAVGAGGLVHAGTVVTRGRADAAVVATGGDTELGGIARSLTGRRRTMTPLQHQLAGLGRRLAVAVCVVAVVVAALNLVAGRGWELSIVLAVSLAVAAIPESLPAVVTLSLAVAARRMARHGVLVRNLAAVEGLGSITVLAVDKTGTVTEGRMRVAGHWCPSDDGERRLLEAAALCNDAGLASDDVADDPLETALLDAARAAGVDVAALRSQWPRTGEEPFDAATRRMTTDHTDRRGIVRSIRKGAPETLAIDPAAATMAATFAEAGHRVLAVAERTSAEDDWELLGLVALADPTRANAADLVAAFAAAGVRTVMITGDHPATARSIAAAIGIDDDDVHARVRPDGKSAVVEALQHGGDVVAMTGDGVNDAPALRAANVGVALGGRGTEVAKQAADLVLVDDDLSAMTVAIAEGRRAYDNLVRFLVYALSGGLAEILVMLVGPLLGLAVPLQAGQILWINLLTHGIPGVALGNEPAAVDVAQRPPRPPGRPLPDRTSTQRVLLLGSLIAATSLGAGVVAHAQDRPWQTVVFVALGTAQLACALAVRTHGSSWRANPLLPGSVVLNLGLTWLAVSWSPLQELLHLQAIGASEYALAVAAALPPALLARWLTRT